MARARLMIGVGISDGIGTTLLEAMALGVFPIVASTSCAGEWIRSGVDGFIVNPHDVDEIAQAITRAATDDVLVDAAAPRNRAEVERRWNARLNSDAALAIYKAVVEGHS
jgi:glycosyltransferase involved in cell wall biosynthesis